MSSGRTHVKASLALASGFSLAAVFSGRTELLECAFGALTGILLTPDLDVDKTYIGDKIIQRRAGWFVRRIWETFWRPYKTSFKHGQFASHFPVWSTFVRLSYIYFWLIFLPNFLIKLLGLFNWELIHVLAWYAILFFDLEFFVGLASSDFIHYTLDKTTKNVD